MTESIDIAELREWIGASESATEVVTADLTNRFAASFDRSASYKVGDEAPLLLHWCLTQKTVVTAALAPDGHPRLGGFLPPVQLPRRMWAGGDISFKIPIRVGDTVTRNSTVADVTVKSGKSGQLVFVTVEHCIDTERGDVVKERQDIVYRNPAVHSPSVPKAEKKAPVAENSKKVLMTSPYLFRYSALTFNSHRIHYDIEYAREVEGYLGLVVHGPLQATLLCQYASDLYGRSPTHFSYRGVAPVFGGDAVSLNAQPIGEHSMQLWTASAAGIQAMVAEAKW